jgi:hypothetical protein
MARTVTTGEARLVNSFKVQAPKEVEGSDPDKKGLESNAPES